ncbi:platelet endothelial aggregation receptor 1-like [Littorina saxatilis]|uniref:platelet endothelial aggregation receptor 1-like n=1 Tax=Littorina saxatilis TaxID=31220 RepID=UPI0038B5E12A
MYESGKTITCSMRCQDTVTGQEVFTSGAADTCTNIQVVCPKGKYGQLCKTCGQCAGKAYCDKVTGHCSACRTPGLTSPLCQACKPRLRGPDCADCVKPGFKPPDCAECQPGFTGPNCTVLNAGCAPPNCDSCKPGWQFPECDRCRPGFKPPDCTECQVDLHPPFCSTCRGGFLPPDCNVCSPGLGGTTCDRCVKPGFQPPDCRQCKMGFLHPNCTGCADGYYGTECSRCGRCAQRAPCDEEDGSCTACDSHQLTMPLCQVRSSSSATEKSGWSTGTLLALGLGLAALLLLVPLWAVYFTRRRSRNNVPGAGGQVPVMAQTEQAKQPFQKQLAVHGYPAFLQQQPTDSVIDDPASSVDGSEMFSASGSETTSASASSSSEHSS